jgi:type II secretory pathway component PulF
MRRNFLRSNQSALAHFFKQLYILFGAGLPLSQILTTLEVRFPDLKIGELKQALDQGKTLADGLKGWDLERSLINIIEVGENSGQFNEALRLVSEILERRLAFRGQIKGALTYPVFVLTASLICVLGLFFFILPVFSQMFSDFNFPLPLITRLVIALPGFWPLGILLLIGSLCFLYQARNNDHIKHRIPGYRHTQVANFARLLGAQIKSSVSVLTALSTCARSADTIYGKAISRARDRVENGEKLSVALADYHALFPAILRQMIAVGEEAGSLDEMLSKAADYYEKEAESVIKQTAVLIEPVSTLAVGLLVGVMAFAMIMPLFSIMNSLL